MTATPARHPRTPASTEPAPPAAWLPFRNPATGEHYGEVAVTATSEVLAAVADMRAAARDWGGRSLGERVRVLRALQGVLVEAGDEISEVISRAHGKSRQDALIENFVTVDNLNTALSHARRWLRRERVASGLYVFKRFYVEPRPYGVVGILAPWNYPFMLALQPMLSALVAGNTVVLKPSEVTAEVGVLIERLIQRVPGVAACVRVVHGDARVGAALVEAQPDLIYLTGSTATGKKVMLAAAQHLLPAVCELGGKDAMIVLNDADVAAAAEWGAWGAIYNTGQTCMAVERAYVMAEVYDAFVDKATAHARQIRAGYSTDPTALHHIGPVTSAVQLKLIEAHVNDAVAKGARVLTGGLAVGNYFEPTVLVDVDHRMDIMREETFGPILPIMKVQEETEAIRLANDSGYGLSASVWSRDLARAEAVAAQLEVGSVIVNDTIAHFAVPTLPFGGVKQSGFGRSHGRDGVLQFTQSRSFATGGSPHPLDIATLLRRPGRYHLASGLLRLAFGVTPRQRLGPVREAMARVPIIHRVTPLSIGLGGLAAVSALAFVIGGRRRRKRS